MKKLQIVMAAVPIACAVGGFGAGHLMGDNGASTHKAIPAPRSAAEAVLHSLAEQQDQHAVTAAPASGHAAKQHGSQAGDHGEQHSALSAPEMLYRAAYTPGQDDAPMLIQAQAKPDMHRIDYEKLAMMEKRAAQEAAYEAARLENEKRIAEMMENPEPARTAHPSLLPLESEAKIYDDALKLIAETDEHVVKLGRLTIPVQGAAATTYFVADFGVSVTDLDRAQFYYEGENAARVRDQVVMTMHHLAETQLLRGKEVDSVALAERVAEDLRQKFFGVEDFIFLSLYKTDVPRA
ncbi:hypothetical protein [Pseudooceanicola sp. MF1-13]|uniref:hypothetical protein n=1 Tax=Pseudooceanicola sp. MF1-13 TaxID=3379095 RepID=UPI003892B180